ncbi:MAG: amidohydrolase [Halobacteriales archaeon]
MADISTAEKATAIDWIADHRSELADLSDEIWGYAEPGLREYDSAATLCEYLRDHGFTVETGLSGMPTAFLATYGEGTPIIGTFAEYDATPGDSQKPVPHEEPVHPEAAGYADMHNGLGVGSIGAVCGLKRAMEEHGIGGTLRLFGTPAEKITVGKPYLARDGYYDDLDVAIAWHPRPYTTVEKGHGPSPCREFIVEFDGESFYSAKPWHGNNALDATTLMRNTISFARQRFDPKKFASISDMTAKGGSHPTSLPGETQSWITTRAVDLETLDRVEEILRRCCEAAATVTGCDVDVRITSAVRPWLNNEALADLAYENLELVGPPSFTDLDKEFGREILENLGDEPMANPYDEELTDPDSDPTSDFLGGADDVNEFCWHAPTCRIYVAYQFKQHYERGYPSWASAALAKTNVAHEALTTAAKAMAGTAIDLLTDPTALEAAQSEFRSRTAERSIEPLLSAEATPPTEESIPPFYPEGWEPPVNVG